MGQSFRIAIAALLGLGVLAGPAFAQSDPPGRVARLAFTEGAVSFHDDEQSDWTQALINTPLTSGDSIWTEAGARSEVSLAGTRVRLDGSTQLDLLQIHDTQTKMQLAQGRLDIKTFTLDTNTPYQIVTPRGTITLNQQGDYYVLAGSTQDATRIGVRSGAASFQGLNGQTLAIRANEVGEVSGDSATPQLRTLNTAPPAMPASWATRDRTVVYDAPQYVNAGMTGYEDLNANGTWSADPDYGQVWTPRSVPAGWEPYRTGRWQYVKPWGWTWVDEQPWGFAPYHYGRWANRNNRWSWVPPQRETRPVYAPALVAFIGGIELSVSLGQQSRAPVGWFPLAPREAYVPPYTTNRDYYNNVNRSNRIQEAMLEDRWQHAQRRDSDRDRSRPDQQRFVPANQRYATVVPSEDFVRSRPVARALIKVALDKLTAAPVARVSAPPAPAQSVNAAPPPSAPAATPPAATPPAATTPPGTRPGATAPAPNTPPGTARGPNGQRPKEPRPADPKAEAEAKAKAEAAAKNVPAAQTEVGGMAVLGKPTAPERPKAPGPKVTSRPTGPAATAPAHPTLQPRVGNAPPALKDDKAPPAAPAKPGQPPQANAPAPADTKAPAPPAAPARPGQPPQATAPAPADTKPPAPPATAQPPQARPQPPQAQPATPPAAPQATPNPAQRPEPPKPGQTEAKPAAPAAQPPAPPVAQPPAPPAANPREGRRPEAPRTEPQRPAENRAASPPPAAQPHTPAAPPEPRQAAPATPPAQPAQPETAPQQAAPPPAATPARPTPPRRGEPNEGQRDGRDDNRRGG